VVGEDLAWIRGTKKDVTPHAESFNNGQKFTNKHFIQLKLQIP
jgi:hypothetical protein